MNGPRALRLFLISDSGPGTVGGAEASLDHLVRALRLRGHTVVRGYAEPGPGDLPPGDYLLDLPQPRTRFRVPRPSFVRRATRGLLGFNGLIDDLRPDVVGLHYVTARAGYLLASRSRNRFAVVLNARGSDVLRPGALDRRWLPAILRRADGVVALSEAIARAIVETSGIAPPPVIHNGVDSDYWSPAPPGGRGGPPLRPLTVVSVGRLEEVKGHDVLVEAFARVQDRVPDAQLLIVGDGSRRGALQDMVADLGVGESVRFEGGLDPGAVRDRLREADVFALPSRSEGLSNALLEALATGVPAVASGVGGIPEVLGQGGGVMVPPEDAAALAGALADLLADRDRRRALAREARDNAAKWSWDATAAAFERVAWDAMQRRKGD